jgi:hypothetical protein
MVKFNSIITLDDLITLCIDHFHYKNFHYKYSTSNYLVNFNSAATIWDINSLSPHCYFDLKLPDYIACRTMLWIMYMYLHLKL